MNVTIYHNPRCSTSRKVLEALQARGIEPAIVEYLKNPPDRATLIGLLRRAGMTAKDLLRRKEPLAAELGLTTRNVADETILAAMLAHPILIERPIVDAGSKAVLCRPPERLTELLDS